MISPVALLCGIALYLLCTLVLGVWVGRAIRSMMGDEEDR